MFQLIINLISRIAQNSGNEKLKRTGQLLQNAANTHSVVSGHMNKHFSGPTHMSNGPTIHHHE